MKPKANTKCQMCGEPIHIETNNECSIPEERLCDECFTMTEASQGMPDESYSDSDSGL